MRCNHVIKCFPVNKRRISLNIFSSVFSIQYTPFDFRFSNRLLLISRINRSKFHFPGRSQAEMLNFQRFFMLKKLGCRVVISTHLNISVGKICPHFWFIALHQFPNDHYIRYQRNEHVPFLLILFQLF